MLRFSFMALWVAFLLLLGSLSSLAVEPHVHQHAQDDAGPPPRIFLDKSPRIVAYQLKRLSNARLLRVERATDDAKYAPVYEAILSRAGMSTQHREEALKALVKLSGNDDVSVLFSAMDKLDGEDRSQRRVTRQLADLVLRRPAGELAKKTKVFQEAGESENPVTRSAGLAAFIAANLGPQAIELSKSSEQATLDFLGAVVMTRNPARRDDLREQVVSLTNKSHPLAVRKAAIGALAFIPKDRGATFELVTPFVADDALRVSAVRTLLKIPNAQRGQPLSAKLLGQLVALAESTPAAQRTTDSFIDMMQLADELMAKVSAAQAKSFRQRLRAVTVRVVRIHTVEEEMRYDVKSFAVEAGRPVQIVLNNEDLMPHNLVVTAPGALKEVAQEGALVGPTTSVSGKQYVPKSEKVLFATNMVNAGQQVRLTFTAPSEPGEYPFVCTFPRHWMRMYGVMIVVKDLDEFARNPFEPKDPTGNNRSFVKKWTIEDLQDKIANGLRGRSAEIGKRIFTEATCAQCHKMKGEGGAVGPELTDVLKRWKGDHRGVLREVLDPSHKVDPKYALQLIATDDGKVLSGVVVADDADTLSIVINPEDPKPIVIQKDSIEEIIRSTKSLMPKALLDRFTEDEIFELLAFISQSGG